MKVLLTGGSGRLGQELLGLLPEVVAPPRAGLDVTSWESVSEGVRAAQPQLIVHAAAYTDVAGAETHRDACWRVNVVGTRHVARAAAEVGAKLVHISTDYVFSGEGGGYREADTPGPAVNFYALSKLVAEEAARAAPRHLIIRTSFRPREFAYPVAYADVYTSQDYVDLIAPQLALAISHAPEIGDELLHIAAERKSVLELARRRRPDVRAGSRAEARIALPADVSLDSGRWEALRAGWAGG